MKNPVSNARTIGPKARYVGPWLIANHVASIAMLFGTLESNGVILSDLGHGVESTVLYLVVRLLFVTYGRSETEQQRLLGDPVFQRRFVLAVHESILFGIAVGTGQAFWSGQLSGMAAIPVLVSAAILFGTGLAVRHFFLQIQSESRSSTIPPNKMVNHAD